MSDFHLQEIQSLQNSLREREEYVIELENRLRALWDKYDGDRQHYMDRIKRLEDIINRAHLAFFSDSSDRKVSIAMHRILDEEVRKEIKP